MFRGINQIQLDDKGRLSVPTRYRDALKQEAEAQVVVTIDTEEKCLLLYPLQEWENIERKIEALPSFNRSVRRIQRLLIGHATELDLDGNGRILLPQPLREYAGLKKGVVIVGQGKKLEIWDDAHWTETRAGWLEVGLGETEVLPPELLNLSL